MNQVSPDNVFAMILARDELIMQLFMHLGLPNVAAAWEISARQIDEAILSGGIDWETIYNTVGEDEPSFDGILDVNDLPEG